LPWIQNTPLNGLRGAEPFIEPGASINQTVTSINVTLANI